MPENVKDLDPQKVWEAMLAIAPSLVPFASTAQAPMVQGAPPIIRFDGSKLANDAIKAAMAMAHVHAMNYPCIVSTPG